MDSETGVPALSEPLPRCVPGVPSPPWIQFPNPSEGAGLAQDDALCVSPLFEGRAVTTLSVLAAVGMVRQKPPSPFLPGSGASSAGQTWAWGFFPFPPSLPPSPVCSITCLFTVCSLTVGVLSPLSCFLKPLH